MARLIDAEWIGNLVGLVTRGRQRSHGFTIHTNGPDVYPNFRTRLLLARYEAKEIRAVRAHIPEGTEHVVELGGGLGLVSCHILQRAPRASLTVLEALRGRAELIERTIRENFPDRAARVVWGIVGDETHAKRAGTTPTTPRYRLSDLAPAAGRFVLVMDIEGAEEWLLEHDAESFSRCDVLICELHDKTTGKRLIGGPRVLAMVERFHKMGLRLAEQDGDDYVFTRRERA